MTDPPGFIDESATSMTFYWMELRRGIQHQGEMEDSVQEVLELSSPKVFWEVFWPVCERRISPRRCVLDATPPVLRMTFT